MAPRNVVSKLVAIFPDIWTDPDSGGLEDIRSQTWYLALVALPRQGESDTLSVLETVVRIDDSDLPFIIYHRTSSVVSPNQFSCSHSMVDRRFVGTPHPLVVYIMRNRLEECLMNG